jgi:hypothetical protein
MQKLSVVGIDIAKQVFHLVGMASQEQDVPFAIEQARSARRAQ